MVDEVRCYYLDNLLKLKQVEHSPFLPSPRHDTGVHRFVIYSMNGEWKDVLATLKLNNKWIIFSAEPEIQEFKKARLTFLQSIRLRYSTDATKLFYGVTDNLEIMRDINGGELWDHSSGLVLPLPSEDDATIERAINLQCKMNLLEEILDLFGCAMLANRDGWGMNILWSNNYRHSQELNTWVQSAIKTCVPMI